MGEVAPAAFKIRGESPDALLALAWCREDHQAAFPVHVHEVGDVMMAARGHRFDQTDPAQSAENDLSHDFEDVISLHAPYPLVCDAGGARHGVDRHPLGKGSITTPRPRPRDVGSFEALFRASHSRHTGLIRQ